MKITRRTDYAIRMLIALAKEQEGTGLPAGELARRQNVPRSLARAILSNLVRAGFLSSSRGAGGGMSLSCRPESITILSVVEAIEGPIGLSLCTTDPEYCGLVDDCRMHQVWLDAEAQLKHSLRARTVADLASAQEVGPTS